MLDFVRSEERTIAGVFHPIEVNIERHDVPFERLILADVQVVAHDGTMLAWPTEAQLDGRFRADAGEVDRAVTCTAYSVHILVQRFIQHDAHIGGSGRADEAQQPKSELNFRQAKCPSKPQAPRRTVARNGAQTKQCRSLTSHVN